MKIWPMTENFSVIERDSRAGSAVLQLQCCANLVLRSGSAAELMSCADEEILLCFRPLLLFTSYLVELSICIQIARGRAIDPGGRHATKALPEVGCGNHRISSIELD